ncbi:MAG: hypothetical protein IPN34_05860 [Planctomycetes bacterium]|nr:hypothetical protein [Planctomycetota bacterium]
MARSIWFLLPLAAAALVIAFLALWQGEIGSTRERTLLEERLRRDRMPPQPAPPPAPEPPTIWFAREEPDWSADRVAEELWAELLALDALVARGTWTREAEDRARTRALSSSAVLARLSALAGGSAASAAPQRALPLVVPLLLADRLAEPALFAPLWSLYRQPILAELRREHPTHAARLEALLARVPQPAAEELVLELWSADPARFLARPTAPLLLRSVGRETSLERLLPRLAELAAPEPREAWLAVARELSKSAQREERDRPLFAALASEIVDAALAKRRPDERLRSALAAEAELLGASLLDGLERRSREAPAGSPARAQLERLARAERGQR